MSTDDKNLPRREASHQADSQTGFNDANDLPSILKRYATAHRRTLVMSDYARSVAKDKNLSDSLRYCGSILTFRHFYTVDKLRLHSAKFCHKHLLCPLCAIRRASRCLQDFIPKIESVLAANSQLVPYLVTLTVKNGPDLRERFRHLVGALSKQSQSRRDALKPGRPFVQFAHADGGLYSIEFKRGKNSGLWHPHVHMLWLCAQAPDAHKLSEEWHKFTGDSFIVDVSPFDASKALANNLMEVLKYALKFSELPEADNWEAYEKLSGRRLIGSFGSLRGLQLPTDLNDDMTDLHDLPYVDLIYRFMGGHYSHQATEAPEALDDWVQANIKRHY
jgi:hypothetical protein